MLLMRLSSSPVVPHECPGNSAPDSCLLELLLLCHGLEEVQKTPNLSCKTTVILRLPLTPPCASISESKGWLRWGKVSHRALGKAEGLGAFL